MTIEGVARGVKALTQVIGTGECSVVDVPAPARVPGSVIVRSQASLISSGTETTLLEFGRASLLDKARSQPERVRQVLQKAATDGLAPTLAAVRGKLHDTIIPGYCQAGVVVEADGAGPFTPGDRVATNGGHAEVVRVPENLAARIPPGVGFESAAFTPLAAIALQGLRLAEPTLGETVVVIGLGLVGQLTVQLVRAQGCHCIGIDTNPERVALARTLGAAGLVAGQDSVVDAVRKLTGGVGADAVLLTLASTSDEPIHQAAEMSRKRGRIVLVGVTGLELRRDDFYEKELTFQVSCSYGPGRYDPRYEQEGVDYPLPFVRWTEKRNFEAVLGLMADGRLNTSALVTHRFPIDEAPAAYDLLLGDTSSLGIILSYPDGESATTPDGPMQTVQVGTPTPVEASPGIVGVLGAGSFARRTLLPAARSAGFDIRTIVSSTGLSATVEAAANEATFASSDVSSVLGDPEIDTVLVLTRHDSHARLTVRALEAGKHVFVEKPLALTRDELERVRQASEAAGKLLLVGFNRRFAPLAAELKQLLDTRVGPVSLILTVNAGHIDADHWVQDTDIGGGRIVGEACHFIDLARFLTASGIRDVVVRSARDVRGRQLDDVSHLTLDFSDGSTAVVHYLANGSSRFPKERIEAFFDGKTAAVDNWRRLRTWGCGRRNWRWPRRMDKGHTAELAAFEAAVRGSGPPPIPPEELFEVSHWSIKAAEMARGADAVDR